MITFQLQPLKSKQVFMTLARPISFCEKWFNEWVHESTTTLIKKANFLSKVHTHAHTHKHNLSLLLFLSKSEFLTKMAQGRGSAMVATVFLCMLMFMLHSEMAHAATYTVGDSGGWTFNVAGWPNGKRFRAGDTLG